MIQKTRDGVKKDIQGKLLHAAVKAAHREDAANTVGSPKRGRSSETSPLKRNARRR